MIPKGTAGKKGQKRGRKEIVSAGNEGGETTDRPYTPTHSSHYLLVA